MASELRVNTLKDAAGNNSVGMEYVANGSAKAWVNFNGTGTVAIRESLNISSLSDVDVGRYSVDYSSAFSDADYVMQNTSRDWYMIASMGTAVQTASTGTIRYRQDNGTHNDSEYSMALFVGDLA